MRTGAIRQSLPSEIAYRQALTTQAMAHPDIERQSLAVQMRGQDIQMRGQDLQSAHSKALEDIQNRELTLRELLNEAQIAKDNALTRKYIDELTELQDSRRLLETFKPTGDILQDLPTLIRLHPASASSYITHLLGGSESAKTRWVQYIARTMGIPEAQALNIILNSSDEQLFNSLAAMPEYGGEPERIKKAAEDILRVKREILGTTKIPMPTGVGAPTGTSVRKPIPTPSAAPKRSDMKAMRGPDGTTVWVDRKDPTKQYIDDGTGRLVPVK